MAQSTRPVFMVRNARPYFIETNVTFPFFAGLSAAQKKRNVVSLHETFKEYFPDKAVLEISSKSLQPEGEPLSAFYLPKFVPSLGKSVPVECVYQGSKVFENGGPYTDLYTATPRAAKKDERLHTSGALIAFEFEGQRFPIKPMSLFYDYIYINALLENEDLAQKALAFDAFTDIEFNPKKSVGCQARSVAKFVSLSRAGLIDQVKNIDTFRKLFVVSSSF